MLRVVQFLTAMLVAVALVGCESTNYDGVYIGSWDGFVLVVDGDKGKGLQLGAFSIKNVVDYKVSYSDKKMFLDTADGKRSVFVRSVDELGLQCLECRGGIPEKLKPHSRPKEEIYKILDDRKQAEMAKQKQQEEAAKAQAEIKKKAHTLTEFVGEWVFERGVNTAPLVILSISETGGIKMTHYDFDTGDHRKTTIMDFDVNGDELTIDETNAKPVYTLTNDGQGLTCLECEFKRDLKKADRNKLKDIKYAQGLAGTPPTKPYPY